MRSELIEIGGERGFHATPAAMFAQTAMKFKANVHVGHYGQPLRDAKNLIAVYALGGKKGDILRVVTEGEDEEEAMDEILMLVASNFKGEG